MGQHYSIKEHNQDKEIQRRIMAGWAAYAKHRYIAIWSKRQVYNSYVLPYGAHLPNKHSTNSRLHRQNWKDVQGCMLNIAYKDRKTNISVRKRTKVIYTIILLKSVSRSYQTAGRNSCARDRLGRCIKLFVSTESTSCYEFASQFGLIFFIREKHPQLSRIPSRPRDYLFELDRLPVLRTASKPIQNYNNMNFRKGKH